MTPILTPKIGFLQGDESWLGGATLSLVTLTATRRSILHCYVGCRAFSSPEKRRCICFLGGDVMVIALPLC